MKSNSIDRLLMGSCLLLALSTVSVSMFGSDDAFLVIHSILTGAMILVLGPVAMGWRRHKRQAVVPALLAFGFSFAIVISTASCQWPLRVAYHFARPAMDRLADKVQNRIAVSTPTRVGIFRIRKVELSSGGIVCLWTKPAAGGNTGFVMCPPDNVPFNLWSITRLGDRWQFMSED